MVFPGPKTNSQSASVLSMDNQYPQFIMQPPSTATHSSSAHPPSSNMQPQIAVLQPTANGQYSVVGVMPLNNASNHNAMNNAMNINGNTYFAMNNAQNVQNMNTMNTINSINGQSGMG